MVSMSSKSAELPRLALRKREMAAALSVSERTLEEWTGAENVPHFKLGNVILYPVDQVREWLKARAAAAAAARSL